MSLSIIPFPELLMELSEEQQEIIAGGEVVIVKEYNEERTYEDSSQADSSSSPTSTEEEEEESCSCFPFNNFPTLTTPFRVNGRVAPRRRSLF
ncbi:bacteriocin [Chlorogloeopsis sp. ULAP01]|uniref:bacteriocin n=1 Tax=Chlorogloeopsis sp. ULAP01 TaxID=3056483 RepID=UPI0025AB5A97|nr:bacteriocin [Chlorogloeopsis sp. ULAP01]MDM9382949.1 bacteriocin [Chlorogloeopsis sp. ULAP01]